MVDFNHEYYAELLFTLQDSLYELNKLEEVKLLSDTKYAMLRHDVDRLPQNALQFARLEAAIRITGTYYFRAVPDSWDGGIIKQIADLGHEIGYHYENMDTCNGKVDEAWEDFRYHLERLRQYYPVKTVCMHGSPLSKYDNRDLWQKYDYKTLGIIAEPYLDIDYDEVFYITDTGRKWNNSSASIRDKVETTFDIPIRSTMHFIKLIQNNKLPEKLLINTHPQRWHNRPLPWVRELVTQKVKNIVKRLMVMR